MQVSWYLVQWFWRRRFFNDPTLFEHFANYLSLSGGWALDLNKIESPSPKDALWQVWLKLVHWFQKKSRKCEKFKDRRTTDKKRGEYLT